MAHTQHSPPLGEAGRALGHARRSYGHVAAWSCSTSWQAARLEHCRDQNEPEGALEEITAPDFVEHYVLPGRGPTREDYPQEACVVEALGRFTGEWWEQQDHITLMTLQRLAARAQT
jgi:hypothetical protein